MSKKKNIDDNVNWLLDLLMFFLLENIFILLLESIVYPLF